MTVPRRVFSHMYSDLRIAKQIERRMVIDALHRLMGGGFPIRDYHYVGFSSLSFIDFVMLYKLAGIETMTAVPREGSDQRRLEFNKPLSKIMSTTDSMVDVIAKLDRDTRYILSLEHESAVDSRVISTTVDAANQLSSGSLIFASANVFPEVEQPGPSAWFRYYQSQVEEYLEYEWDENTFRQSELPAINIRVLYNAVVRGLNLRRLRFLPLFMLHLLDEEPTVMLGGLVGTESEERNLEAVKWEGADYLRRRIESPIYQVQVPHLTRRERGALDRMLPIRPGWKSRDFDMSITDAQAYSEVHRFYPSYAELLF